MDINTLLKAAFIGLVSAGPIGPTALFCIRKTWQWNRLAGCCIGLGAAGAATVWAIIACAGFSTLYSYFDIYSSPFVPLCMGVLLMIIAFRHLYYAWNNYPLPRSAEDAGTLKDLAITSFFLTLCDPLIALTIISIFAHMDFEKLILFAPDRMIPVVIGVFTGALSWWIFLVIATARYNTYLFPHHAHYINFIIGLVLLIIATYFLYKSFLLFSGSPIIPLFFSCNAMSKQH